ncbi:Sporulation related domain-containing protein [Mucilaginibacter mallensis]|uniref:Sporulation related domain-containing protein n=1 Tax=Mucilaginibacter mallensis TaxID=652787 RepID=A0A1H1NXV0_MUCMA|nr:SPOR domain-containing protein [Mucilaginibacter mallensis]SDS03630.1 Sporulation related domain-containing protein [Mucilaginibacter mallensis]
MKDGSSFYKTIAAAPVRCCVLFGLMLLPSLLFAQEKGKVEVVKDPKVDSLVQDYVVGDKGKNIAPASSDGYRIQIFSGSDRQAAYDAQAKLKAKYPDLATYLSYRAPNFKVRVGDYRSRLEAEKVMQDLKPLFGGLFITQEKINLPKLDTE